MKARMLLSGLLLAAAACGGDTTAPPPTVTAPTVAPANVVVQVQSSTTATINFDVVTGATGYEVERVQGATGGTFARVAQATASPFNDTGLLPSTTYRYRVRALNTVGTGPYSAEISNTTLQPGRTVVNVTSDITTNTTWVADNVYRLQGFRKVASGATLTIQAGTRIEGDFNTVGSSLFVLRGARIIAIGTEQFPIVFTSSRVAGTRQPGDWGGLILVGNARINRVSPVNLEGTGTSADNALIDYAGGTNDADDSGELRYVRVEFAGFAPAQDAELNSFTFAAVGSATDLNYLQVLAGLDDSFEWFGGTSDAKYLVSYEAGDDHFDMAEGFSGRLQFLIGFQSRVLTPRAGGLGNVSTDPQLIENDGCNGAGCTGGQDAQPFTVPLVSNFTLVGFPSTGVTVPVAGGRGMVLRRGTGGFYYNGLFARHVNGGISLRDAATTGARLTAGLLDVRNHQIYEAPSIYDASTNVTLDAAANAITLNAAAASTIFTALPSTPTTAASFDWTPVAGSGPTTGGLAAFTGAALTKGGTFQTGTSYVGAAQPAGAKWWANWTNYAIN